MDKTFEEVIRTLKETVFFKYDSYHLSLIKYAYHYSDLGNIISILNQKKIYSRKKSEEEGLMLNDNASTNVIGNTDDRIKEYVRFYFRPKTPTQYHNEGFKLESAEDSLDAHCPLPVFLLVDLISLLNADECSFSEISLARKNTNLMNSGQDFLDLPFEKIYHKGRIDTKVKEDIIAHRQAEIVIPNEYDISNSLMKIMVRSFAEKQTLINSLPLQMRDEYEPKIYIDSRKNFFNGMRLYINEVELSDSSVLIKFNCGEYDLSDEVCIKYVITNKVLNKIFKYEHIINVKPSYKVHMMNSIKNYDIEILINGHLAYKHSYSSNEDIDLPY